MNDFLGRNFENNIPPEDMQKLLVNFNKFFLSKKPHIKKYYRIRKLHGEILDSMENYLFSGKYDTKEYDDIINGELGKIVDDFDINFDFDNEDDMSIFTELFIYPNHVVIPSITEVYLKDNKFRKKDKIEFLKSMRDSYAGLFKITDVDRDEGYVTYEDVFTKKKFKIIDVAMSSSLVIAKEKEIYSYNRIITFDGISFATGIHCNFSSKSESLMKFISTHDYKKCSSFVRCLLLYDIYKKDGGIVSCYNHNYGSR